MRLNVTDFRKSLFPLLERVLRGETVEVQYKGATIKLVAAGSSSKLARAKRQHALLCPPDEIVHGDTSLLKEMEKEWRKDWDKL